MPLTVDSTSRKLSGTTLNQKLNDLKQNLMDDEAEGIELDERGGAKRRGLSFLIQREKEADTKQEVGILQLVSFLTIDVEKRTHLRQLVPYVAFLGVLTALVWHSRLPSDDYSDALQATEELKNSVLFNELQEVYDPPAMWEWLRKVTLNLWSLTDERVCEAGLNGSTIRPLQDECNPTAKGSRTMPIGMVSVRQWRVKVQPCGAMVDDLANALPPCDLSVMPCNCTHKYADSRASSEAYGPFGRFKTDAARGLPKHPLGLQTDHVYYDDTSVQYSLLFPLPVGVDDVIQSLRKAEEDGWVDEQTRLVSLEIVFFNPDSEVFVRGSCFVEYFQTGRGLPGCFLYAPFSLERFSDDATDAVLSLVLFCFLIPMVYWLVESIYFRFNMKKDWAIWGEVVQGAHVITLAAVCYLRGNMWNYASIMTSGYFYEDYAFPEFGGFGHGSVEGHLLFHYISVYTTYSTVYDEFIAICLVISWLRIFRFLQHVPQLNMLTETMKHAATGVARLSIIFAYCVAAYSIAGSVVFGPELRDFQTPSHAASALLRMFFMEHETNYERMRTMQPFWAPVYMISFLMLCYFMLLNMVLAVIVSSFALVQSAEESAQKHMEAKQEMVLDQQIADLRSRSNTVAVAGASQRPSRLHRVSRKLKENFGVLQKQVNVLVDTNNEQREKAIQLAKEYCARDLRIPRDVLKERPEYYGRVAITKSELKKVFHKLLSDEDIDAIFMGVQKKSLQSENAHVAVICAVEDLSSTMKERLTDIESRFGQMDDRMTVFEQRLLKDQQRDAEVRNLREKLAIAESDVQRLSVSTRNEEEGGRAFRRHLNDLNEERSFLIDRLAATEHASVSRSYRGDVGSDYMSPPLPFSPISPAASYASPLHPPDSNPLSIQQQQQRAAPRRQKNEKHSQDYVTPLS
ncbi:Polycystin-2 [Diplonema papillatum]|nr:Polycystin-2 [Diplonema papillatum]